MHPFSIPRQPQTFLYFYVICASSAVFYELWNVALVQGQQPLNPQSAGLFAKFEKQGKSSCSKPKYWDDCASLGKGHLPGIQAPAQAGLGSTWWFTEALTPIKVLQNLEYKLSL